MIADSIAGKRTTMDVYLHGFDWTVYAEQVMPALERWLVRREEGAAYHLFKQTRCALEEEYLPSPMRRLRTWTRAKDFVDGLPRGPHSRKEYAKLCSAEQFTSFSDRFLHNYTPQLYKTAPALRNVWGALVEQYCVAQFAGVSTPAGRGQAHLLEVESEQATHSEMIALLHDAGLGDMAVAFAEKTHAEQEQLHDKASSATGNDEAERDPYADKEQGGKPPGILIGQQVNTLRLRGWLAGLSVRAMALFELLACGRRLLPFGYDANDPYGAYYGYLTPGETWQFASSLLHARPCSQTQAENDYQQFCMEQIANALPSARLLDEVLPAYARDLLHAARHAAAQGLGLICVTD